MAGFSGALKLTGLDDFITPSQECIKPVSSKKKSSSTKSVLKIQEDGTYLEVDEYGVETKPEKATISLNDCLACSGCITSAESVLITQQSQEELYRILEENRLFRESGQLEKELVVVVSISPQSRASIAVHFESSAEETASKLTSFFKTLGVHYIFDTTFSRDFALIESAHEFVRRFKSAAKSDLPMLTSACPGWICYAEKTHGSFILPYISSTKSPQQIMGSLVKSYLTKLRDKTPDQVYHVTVMPCYDKKLEASRGDFYQDLYQTRDVDCVITTGEVLKMFEEKSVDFASLPTTAKMDEPLSCYGDEGRLLGHSGGGSGGYLEYVLKHAARELFDCQLDLIEYRVLRNKDFRECSVEVDGKVVLKFAAAYGFRNIQNLVQQLKRRRCAYHFVEIMACPSGCLNGGGQISFPSETAQDHLAQINAVYNSVLCRAPRDNSLLHDLYRDWLEGAESGQASRMLHTEYHAVEKFVNALTIKW